MLYMNDSKEYLVPYIKKKNIKYPIYMITGFEKNNQIPFVQNNSSKSIFSELTNEEKYKITSKLRFGIPCTILLDENKKVKWIKSGYREDMEKEIENKYKEI